MRPTPRELARPDVPSETTDLVMQAIVDQPFRTLKTSKPRGVIENAS
jgi:hypothetical protein